MKKSTLFRDERRINSREWEFRHWVQDEDVLAFSI